MRISFRRAIVTLVAAPYLGLSGVAPEHLHEADADHPHSTVHRHQQPHLVGSHDRDHAELSDDDDHIVWLQSDAAVYQGVYHLLAPALPSAEGFESVPPLVDWVAPLDYDTAPPHGPPRSTRSLRAPPSLSA